MNTNENTSKGGRFRTFMRYAGATRSPRNRALLRYPPYDDYLLNRRSGR